MYNTHPPYQHSSKNKSCKNRLPYNLYCAGVTQERPAITDKQPARLESLPKIAAIGRA